MEHTEAVNIGATERYLLGELADDECQAFEEHYFSCAECAADVRAAAALAEDAAVLLRDEPRATTLAPRALAAPGPARRRPLALFWPMPLGAAAAFVLAFTGLAWQTLTTRDLRRELAEATAPQPASSAFLSASRSEEQSVWVERGERWVNLTLTPPSVGGRLAFYRYRLTHGDTTLRTWVQKAAGPGEELRVNLPLRDAQSGSYVLALDGLQDSSDPVGVPDVARYQFSLRYRGE